jgi:hypothetical protein
MMADGNDVVAGTPREKSKRPTNKWFATQVTAIATFLVALIQNEWQLSSELQVVLVGLVAAAVISYLLPNSDTPGGVPEKSA